MLPNTNKNKDKLCHQNLARNKENYLQFMLDFCLEKKLMRRIKREREPLY